MNILYGRKWKSLMDLKLKRITLFVIIFICFSTNISWAISKNEKALKEYISKGYDQKILVHRNALLRFQAENNLSVDGIIGEITKKALLAEKRQVEDTIPKEVKGKKWFIIINKTKKILTVYKDGQIYKKYPVALGKSTTPTPDHKFTIINKVKDPYWNGMGGKFKPVKGGAPNNPLGKRWIGLSRDKYKGYGIHGNSAAFSIGQYISAGCIRMINEDVEELFEYIPVRTDVWVGTENILAKWGVKQSIKLIEKEKPKEKPEPKENKEVETKKEVEVKIESQVKYGVEVNDESEIKRLKEVENIYRENEVNDKNGTDYIKETEKQN